MPLTACPKYVRRYWITFTKAVEQPAIELSFGKRALYVRHETGGVEGLRHNIEPFVVRCCLTSGGLFTALYKLQHKVASEKTR